MRVWNVIPVLFASALFSTPAVAQRNTRPLLPGQTGPATAKPAVNPKISKTLVTVELIQGKEAMGIGLAAQEWGQAFEQLGMAVQIRRQLLDEKPELKEKMVGTIREVRAIGMLDKGGRIVFPDRAFTTRDTGKLKEWINELQTYGAQGAPTGKPLWGLREAQFASLFGALARKVETEVEGLPLTQALSRLGVPESYPLRMTVGAREWIASEFPKAPPVRNRVEGMTLGTALAIVTNEYGLGVRPLRTPDGKLEMVIDPLKSVREAWPIGWDLKLTRQKTAPKLFELIPVELEDVKLLEVLDAVEEKTKVPVHVDYYRIEGKLIVLEDLIVSYPMKQTSWSLLLKGVTNPHKLTRRIQIDEGGRPFLWVTVLEPGRADD